MGWGSAIGAIGGLLGANQASQGGEANARAIGQGVDFAKGVYGTDQGNYAPYMGIGQTGLNGLQALAGGDYSGFYNSPDYQSARDAMTYAGDHSAAANYRLGSGGYQADLSAAQGGLANQFLGNYRNGLMGLAGLGLQGTQGVAQSGANASNTVMQGYTGIGNARQSAYDARAGGLMGLGNMFGRAFGSGG